MSDCVGSGAGGCSPTGHSSAHTAEAMVEGAKLAKFRNVFLLEDEALRSQ